MPIIENSLFGSSNLEEMAIGRIQSFETKEGYWVGLSGGKDSSVIYDLVKRSKVKAKYFHALTTIDPPQVVWHIREHYKDCEIMRPQKPLLIRMVEKNCLPMRLKRWCCADYKENYGKDRFVITGVRKAESPRRNGLKMIDFCSQQNRRTLNVIFEWSDAQVWEYIKENELPINPLYLEPYNYERIGCVLCPMVRDIERQKRDFPKLYEAWHRAVIRMYDKGIKEGKKIRFKSGEELWNWWLDRDAPAFNDDQLSLF